MRLCVARSKQISAKWTVLFWIESALSRLALLLVFFTTGRVPKKRNDDTLSNHRATRAWLESLMPSERKGAVEQQQEMLSLRSANRLVLVRFLKVFHPMLWRFNVVFLRPQLRKISVLIHRYGRQCVANVLMISIVGSLFLPFHHVDAATYTWVQTDWSGGASTTLNPTHASDQTGWTKYEQASTTIAVSSGSLALGLTYATTTQTSQADFEGGTLSTVATSTGSVILSNISATGGTITTSGSYRIHTFTSSGTFTPNGSLSTEYLVVAGGGAGAGDGSTNKGNGGGGAGGMRTGTGFSVTAQAYTITVGAGGVGASSANRVSGSDSTFSSITSTGGGGGGYYSNTAGAYGGSGGGGGADSGGGGNYVSGQGQAGAAGTSNQGGGGGGAGEAGNTDGTGQGGDGVASSISGSSVTYAGGGGGSAQGGTARAGGDGGGGDSGSAGVSGTANTGGGGGAQVNNGGSSGSGGSGIVIIRYVTTYTASGTFTSSVIDTGQTNVAFSPLDYTATVPANTTLTLNVRAGNTATPDGTWTSYSGTIADLGSLSAYNGYRYIQYKANLATTDTTATPTLSDVAIGYGYYTSGALVSSAFDTGSTGNVLGNLTFSAATTSVATVKFQLRTGTGTATTSWMGPNGTGSTFFSTSTSSTIPSALSDGSNDRFIQYKAFLTSTSASTTPTLNDVTLTYVVNAAPDFQTDPTASQASISTTTIGVVAIDYIIRDTDSTSGSVRPGYIVPSFEYSINGGSSYTSITSPLQLTASATSTKAVSEGSYNSYALYWYATSTSPSTYVTNARIRITADDGEGANNTVIASTSNFTLDTKSPTSPTVSINSAAAKTNSVSTTLTLSASDDSSLQMILSESSSFSGASWETYASSKAFTLSSTDAVKTVYAKFRDNYGNESSTASDTITLDTTAPTAPSRPILQDVSNASSTAYRLFFSWEPASNSDFASHNVYRSTDGSSYSLLLSTTSQSANYYLDTGLTAAQRYYYQVKTTDDIGNSSASTTAVSLIAGGNPSDSSAPSISSVASGSLTPSSARITWTTDEISDSSILFGTSASSLTSTQGNTTYATSHVVTLVGLTSGTTYYYQVKSTDPSSNYATSTTATFATSAGDSTGPSISVISATATTTSATITWTTDESANSFVEYSTTNGFSSGTVFGQDDSVTSHSIVLPSVLTSNTTYYYKVRSRDVARNETASAQNSFTTATVSSSDTTAPSISSVTSSGVAYNTATVTWTTDESSTSFVEFGQTTEFGRTAGNYTLATSHSVSLPKDLFPSTTYYYRVRSTDVSGNEKVSSNSSFSTSASPSDTTAPSISAIVAGTPSATGFSVTWTTDEVSDSFIEYGTGSTSATYALSQGTPTMVTSHSVALIGLTPSTQYFYRVKSADPSNNTSRNDNSSAGYTFATAASNSNSPVLSNVVITDVGTSTAIVTWTTDKVSDSFVEFGFDTAYGRVAGQYDSVTSHSVSLPRDLLGDVTYHFRARSMDSDKNISVSGDLTFTTAPSAAVTIAEDGSSPVISSVQASITSTDEAVITWITDELSTSRVDWGSSTAYSETPVTSSTSTIEHAVRLTGLTTGATYYYRVKSTDPSGNQSTSDNSSAGYTFTTDSTTSSGGTRVISLASSEDAPFITDLKLSSITMNEAIATFTSSRDASSLVSYGTTTELQLIQGGTEKRVSKHELKMLGLRPGTQYFFKVRVIDLESRSRSSSINTFTTPLQRNDVATPIDFTTSTSTRTETVFEPKVASVATSTKDAFVLPKEGLTSAEQIKADRISSSVSDGLLNSSSALVSRVVNNFFDVLKRSPFLSSVDETTFTASVTEAAAKIVTAPVISSDAISVELGPRSAVIGWRTDKNANSLVSYAVATDYKPGSEAPYAITSGFPDASEQSIK